MWWHLSQRGSGTRKFAGKISDPKGGADVARVAKNSIEITLADESPETGVVQSPKTLGIRAFVGDLDPRVAVQQRNIPLDFRTEFGSIPAFAPRNRQ